MIKTVNANLILEYRKANNLTIKEFCKQCHIGATTYCNIIKEKRASIKVLLGIAKIMNMPMTELFVE